MERSEKRSPGGEAQPFVPVWRSTWRRDPPLIASDIHSTIVVVVVVEIESLDREVRAPELVRCFCFVGHMLICRKKKKSYNSHFFFFFFLSSSQTLSLSRARSVSGGEGAKKFRLRLRWCVVKLITNMREEINVTLHFQETTRQPYP